MGTDSIDNSLEVFFPKGAEKWGSDWKGGWNQGSIFNMVKISAFCMLKKMIQLKGILVLQKKEEKIVRTQMKCMIPRMVCHSLIPETYEYAIVHGKREFADIFEIIDLKRRGLFWIIWVCSV